MRLQHSLEPIRKNRSLGRRRFPFAGPESRIKGGIVRADRPGGGRIAFDPESCIEFPLPSEGHQRRTLYHKENNSQPSKDLWIYREQNKAWSGFRALDDLLSSNWHWGDGICRIVNREEAAEMFQEAGLAIPPGAGRAPTPAPMESGRPQLLYGGTLCRKYVKEARNQLAVFL